VTGCDGRISRVHYVLPRQKAANWVGPGRGRKTTRPGANGVGGHAARGDVPADCCDSCDKLPSHDTSRRQRPTSWLGWARSFLLRTRGVVATSDSEETADRSRLTRSERFASGRRPGWLRPREVSH